MEHISDRSGHLVSVQPSLDPLIALQPPSIFPRGQYISLPAASGCGIVVKFQSAADLHISGISEHNGGTHLYSFG